MTNAFQNLEGKLETKDSYLLALDLNSYYRGVCLNLIPQICGMWAQLSKMLWYFGHWFNPPPN